MRYGRLLSRNPARSFFSDLPDRIESHEPRSTLRHRFPIPAHRWAPQEQWRRAGVELELRPLELATLFSDVAKGNFQITYQRWVGANTDPDFFEYAFSSKPFPPDGANRGHYRNSRIDALTDQIRVEMNQEKRKLLCGEVQRILAEDLPYLPLWFNDVVSVHRRALGALDLSPSGDYNFLRTLQPSGN